jgi:glycosidase
MHHPGPPRFTSVGQTVELAPRRPDAGDDTFSWTLTETPPESAATLGSDAVEILEPDEPGVYRARLSAPDGDHDKTVRVFPDERRPIEFTAHADELPQMDEISVTGRFNDHRLGIDTPDYADHVFSFETRLLPGEYTATFVPDGNFREVARDTQVVDGPERPRITLDATVEDGTVTVTATPLSGPTTDETAADLDVEFYVDDRDRPFEALAVDGRTATAPLSAVDDQLRVHAVAVGKRHSVADAVTVEADGSVDYPNDAPEWVEHGTMYEIFTRAFTGDADATFRAIERRVPYLEWMGVDTLWMTPVLDSYSPQRDLDGLKYGGPHGYDTLDYHRTAPDLGTREEFQSLVETCHDHGIKVVFDLVINHTSKRHPEFQMHEAGVEGYEDRYVRRENGEPEMYFSWSSIPNLDYTSLATREKMLGVVEEWADVVDGFRCDVAWGVPHGFWQEVRERVKATDSEFLLLDETVPREPLAHENAFDLHYDTTLYGQLREIGRGEAPAESVLDAVEAERREGFPPRSVQLRYVENHDEDRYLKECDRATLKAAAAATFTLPGMPMLYYGQETGMLSYRDDMEWGGDDELTEFHRRLSLARDDHPVLRTGSIESVAWSADDERSPSADRGRADGGSQPVTSGSDHGGRGDSDAESGVVAYARENENRRAVVVLNFGSDPVDVTVEEAVGETDLVTGEHVVTDSGGDSTTLTVDSVAVLDG